MKDKFMFILYRSVLPYGGLILILVFSVTYRIRIIDPQYEIEALEKDGSVIYASWHQRFFPGITFFAKRKPIAILISKSRDGELISRIVSMLGWYTVRGSSSKNGRQGLHLLKVLAKKGYRIGHIVDGPKGPFGKVKPGLLRIAQVSGMAIIPTIISAENTWSFRSWDRFMVPKPFSRVIIRFGEPIRIPPDFEEEVFEEKGLYISQRMHELYEESDHIWSDQMEVSKIFMSNNTSAHTYPPI